jgi:SAM-dependent methyltransferase
VAMTMQAYWEARYHREGMRTVSRHGLPDSYRQQLEVFGKALPRDRKFDCVLDFGCGVGRFAGAIASLARGYLGADPVQRAIELCPRSDGLSFVVDEGQDLGKFDLVVAITVLQHVPDSEVSGVIQRLVRMEPRRVVLIEGNWLADEAPHVFPRRPSFYALEFGFHGFRLEVLSAEGSHSHYTLVGER